MTTYYETFLRQEIYFRQDDKTEILCEIWERQPRERHYIELVIDDYISGGSKYQAQKRLQFNVIDPYKRIQKKGAYLDEEYKNKMH